MKNRRGPDTKGAFNPQEQYDPGSPCGEENDSGKAKESAPKHFTLVSLGTTHVSNKGKGKDTRRLRLKITHNQPLEAGDGRFLAFNPLDGLFIFPLRMKDDSDRILKTVDLPSHVTGINVKIGCEGSCPDVKQKMNILVQRKDEKDSMSWHDVLVTGREADLPILEELEGTAIIARAHLTWREPQPNFNISISPFLLDKRNVVSVLDDKKVRISFAVIGEEVIVEQPIWVTGDLEREGVVQADIVRRIKVVRSGIRTTDITNIKITISKKVDGKLQTRVEGLSKQITKHLQKFRKRGTIYEDPEPLIIELEDGVTAYVIFDEYGMVTDLMVDY